MFLFVNLYHFCCLLYGGTTVTKPSLTWSLNMFPLPSSLIFAKYQNVFKIYFPVLRIVLLSCSVGETETTFIFEQIWNFIINYIFCPKSAKNIHFSPRKSDSPFLLFCFTFMLHYLNKNPFLCLKKTIFMSKTGWILTSPHF